MSVLSARPDGMGAFYGRLPGDTRLINVYGSGIRPAEVMYGLQTTFNPPWKAYVADKLVGDQFATKDEAEAAAVAWAKANPGIYSDYDEG